MFFTLSKLAGLVLEPLNLVALATLLGFLALWRQRLKAARWLLGFPVAMHLAVLALPLGAWMLGPLERRFPVPELPARVDGIVMLGGAQQPLLTAAHGQPALNGAAERMTTFLMLARRYPKARLVFTGGSGNLMFPEALEGPTVRLFLRQQGFDPARVSFEERSRNTWDNAWLTRDLVKPAPGETWLLVTSAAHMPRSVGAFRKAGFPILPYPCDYEMNPHPALLSNWSLAESYQDFAHGIHEWVGLAVYRITGKSDALLPGPG